MSSITEEKKFKNRFYMMIRTLVIMGNVNLKIHVLKSGKKTWFQMGLGMVLYSEFSYSPLIRSINNYQYIKGSKNCHILNKFMSIFE